MTELPLRVIDQPGGAVIRCMCGKELASLRRAIIGGVQMARTVGYTPTVMQLSPDVTTAGLIVMVLHARSCKRGGELLIEQQRIWSGAVRSVRADLTETAAGEGAVAAS